MPEPPVAVTRVGTGPPVVLVHGAMSDGARTWAKQQPLAERWQLVILDRRGYGANPPADVSDFEVDAVDVVAVLELLDEPAHLVGHSYGGVVALFAAAARPDAVRSLALLEAPAHAVARGEPEIETDIAEFDERRRTVTEPRPFFLAFLERMGAPADGIPDPLPPDLERDVRLFMHERPPWELPWPTAAVAAAGTDALVVTGGHLPLLEHVADVLADRLGPTAGRVVLEGRGHLVQRTPGFNDRLEGFLRGSS